jgi:hypothetical protein
MLFECWTANLLRAETPKQRAKALRLVEKWLPTMTDPEEWPFPLSEAEFKEILQEFRELAKTLETDELCKYV